MLNKLNGKEIEILGEKWKIIVVDDKCDDRIIDQAGFTDRSTREIGLMEIGKREVGEIKDRDRMLRHTLRHEIIHALIAECGIDMYVDWASDELVVDFFAHHYPKFKKIFESLGIGE